MQFTNVIYKTREDLPSVIPVFPVLGMLLLPGGTLSINIFETFCVTMVDSVLAGNRLVGLIQPEICNLHVKAQEQYLSQIGCIGRITAFAETGDGGYIITLTGICRFRLLEEAYQLNPWRCFYIAPFVADLEAEEDSGVDRVALLKVFRNYLLANNLDADWESVEKASNVGLVNSLSMMSVFSAAEKQALLEAPDFRTRARILIAIMQITLAHNSYGYKKYLQ
ncbi:Uncharacterized protein B488_12950 [Liberibacter crescens BT-1]|uniref:Lon N-terminal domain-containing protein n=1 Tax=Liberibacter crescens (strain BT-1) TaxID=1215343 RepID=L0EWE8_LIBCB|nr:LON peptidase substrate-binding domain-containing protein [Liberibacter crescens]AGA65287.1 Uncharacterized protein B488_12950 [Liberibacter crescens BT-1]AMC13220.1 peptidase S16 [Liberibacter crescens]